MADIFTKCHSYYITKCDKSLSQNATVITKCAHLIKMRAFPKTWYCYIYVLWILTNFSSFNYMTQLLSEVMARCDTNMVSADTRQVSMLTLCWSLKEIFEK